MIFPIAYTDSIFHFSCKSIRSPSKNIADCHPCYVYMEQLSVNYSKVQKYVDSSSVNNDPTAAGEDCILASLERPSNYRLYYKKDL